MPKDYFPPLPKKEDQPLAQILATQAGRDQLKQFLQRYADTFYRTITFAGNLYSSNWNGDAPPATGNPSDATEGFYLNAEDGILQITEAFIDSIVWVDADDGTKVGDLGSVNTTTGDFDGVGLFLDDINDEFRIYFMGSEAFRVTSSGLQHGGVPIGAWKDWTPVTNNLTDGDGFSVVARYAQIGKTVHVRFDLTLGENPVIGSGPTVTLPVEAATSGLPSFVNTLGGADFIDASPSATRHGHVRLVSSTTFGFGAYSVVGSQVGENGISSTIPFTWAEGDRINCSFTYEAA